MIIFSEHSVQKLSQRNLTRQKVLEAFVKPDKIVKTYGNRTALLKKFGDLYLKVIYKQEGKNLIIITQHWVEKI